MKPADPLPVLVLRCECGDEEYNAVNAARDLCPDCGMRRKVVEKFAHRRAAEPLDGPWEVDEFLEQLDRLD